MAEPWWETKEYQLQTGKWIPQAHVLQLEPGGVKVERVLAPKGKEFDTKEAAREYSAAMAQKWIQDKYS